MRGSTAAWFQLVEEGLARQRAGAPRRQEQRRGRERERVGEAGKPVDQRPLRNAWISVGRNFAEAGMVKTRGDIVLRHSGRHSRGSIHGHEP